MSDDLEGATNRLGGETSAYLRQHMRNPVDWYPWSEAALARAREEDRPLLVSIGYSACHWCHVMERESFEDPETAALMNELFVCVKVDREERPDVDQLYMDTVVRLTGHGGWPLTVFCAPDGRPFYGGTYYPPEPRHGMPAFRDLLRQIDQVWRERRNDVEESSQSILRALAARPAGVAEGIPGRETLIAAARSAMERADRRHGGTQGGPKFPMPTTGELLLAALDELPADEGEDVLAFVTFSCREMARRGLYDQLGGGFHRYCVDEHWGVPHFEKMLYDQGQLLRLYAEAWRRGGGEDADLLWPIHETAGWLRREMAAPDGGWYASQDADSEGVEGKFYVWTPGEVEAVLGKGRASAFCKRYAVSKRGNFEGSNVLWDEAREPRDVAAPERAELLATRTGRVPPQTDRKRLTAWNALTVSGLAFAGSVTGAPELLHDAVDVASFLLERLRDEDGRLLRVFSEGEAKVGGFLDDHAALLAACLDLHRAGAGDAWLAPAAELAETIVERFFDPDESDLFLTPADGERLVHRPRSDHDGATPDAAALAVLGLLRAASLTGNNDFRRVAERVIRTHAYLVERAPAAFPSLVRAAAWAERGLGAAVISGDPDTDATRALAERARRVLAPEEAVLVIGSAGPPAILDPAWTEGRTASEPTAWICRGTACSLAITEPRQLDSSTIPGSER